jgi:hypothetical protein
MLHNDDKLNAKSFMLSYDSQSVPAGWDVNINGGQLGLDLAPDEIRSIPVEINPLVSMPLGATAAVVIQASSLRLLVNDKNPSDTHPDFNVLGGVRVEGHAVAQTHLTCVATHTAGGVSITGKLTVDPPGILDPHIPVFLAGLAPAGIDPSLFTAQATLAADGTFTGTITRTGFSRAVCLFAGTDTLGSATSGYLRVP